MVRVLLGRMAWGMQMKMVKLVGACGSGRGKLHWMATISMWLVVVIITNSLFGGMLGSWWTCLVPDSSLSTNQLEGGGKNNNWNANGCNEDGVSVGGLIGGDRGGGAAAGAGCRKRDGGEDGGVAGPSRCWLWDCAAGGSRGGTCCNGGSLPGDGGSESGTTEFSRSSVAVLSTLFW